MIFLDSIAELVRAVERGRLQAQDQVYVPLRLLRAASDAEAEVAEQSVLRVGAHFHALPGLARVAVLSFRELNEGLEPAGRRDA